MESNQQPESSQREKAAETRAVKAYLRAIEPQPGSRRVSRDTLEKRLARVEAKIAESEDPLEKIDLIQSKLDIEGALAKADEAGSLEDLESGFIAHARRYAERKGISYTAWREFGVSAKVLRAAGIPETRRR